MARIILHRLLADPLGRARTIKQAYSVNIEIAQLLQLEPVSQNGTQTAVADDELARTLFADDTPVPVLDTGAARPSPKQALGSCP